MADSSFLDPSLSKKRSSPSFPPPSPPPFLKIARTDPSSPSSQLSSVSVCDNSSDPTRFPSQPSLLSPFPTAAECGAESAGFADSCHSCLAAESKELASSDADGLLSHEPLLRRSFSQAAESCTGDDAQLDINSFLENWEEDAGGLDIFSDEAFDSNSHPSLADCSDAVSSPYPDAYSLAEAAIADGDWFLNDHECGGQIFWNEALQDQEWMTAAIDNLDRINDTVEEDASMLQMLETTPGI